MIEQEQDTVFFTVDIGMWAIRDVLEKYPERCMNIGIFEDAMMTVASGLAKRNLIPTIFGIQPYLIERTLEQIKMDLAYQKLGVNVVGTGAAVDYSKYGYSHYCAEDAMVIKAIPGVEFIAPGTAREFLALYNQTYRNGNSTFFRISDHPNLKCEIEVEFGKANVIQKGNKATVIAVSIMLDTVMEVCKGEDVTVLYYTTLEPFDKNTLVENCASKNILICEPEYKGTLTYDVCEAFEGESIRVRNIGFPREIFRNYGAYEEKIEYYGLNATQIKHELYKLIDKNC